MEALRLEKISEVIQSVYQSITIMPPRSTYNQYCPLNHVPQFLNTSRGSLAQCTTTLSEKKLFLIVLKETRCSIRDGKKIEEIFQLWNPRPAELAAPCTINIQQVEVGPCLPDVGDQRSWVQICRGTMAITEGNACKAELLNKPPATEQNLLRDRSL